MPRGKKAQAPADDFDEPIVNEDALDDIQDDTVTPDPPLVDRAAPAPPLARGGDEEWSEEDAIAAPSYLDDISDDSVRLYLREIGKIPLLSPEKNWHLPKK